MSTKAIRDVLGDAGFRAPDTCDETMARKVAAAWTELERIEAAAKTMTAEDVTPEQVRAANATLESIAREAP